MPVTAGGDQHGGLAVCTGAKAHGSNPALMGRRDGRVQHKTVGDRNTCYGAGIWTIAIILIILHSPKHTTGQDNGVRDRSK